MLRLRPRDFCRLVFGALAMLITAAPATAQYRLPRDPAVGEVYHIEASGTLWNPTPTLIVSSEALGIQGTDVDLVADLGIEKKRLPELRLVLRPARKHKFRLNYVPIKYEAEGTVQREFIFNAQRYRIGLPVNTTADLTTIRLGYEYDFVYLDKGYAGFLLDLKYTNVDVGLNSPIGAEFARAVAPIPTIGFTGRGYVTPAVSITGEVTFFKVPENLGGDDFGGRYIDFDFYGTVNFNRYAGAQIGYRSIDVEYFQDLDSGTLTFRGMYFGGVIRY